MNKGVLSVVAVLVLLAAGTWYVTARLNAYTPEIESSPSVATTTPEAASTTPQNLE